MEDKCSILVRAVVNRSVVGARLDENGHLILEMSDNSQVDVGRVQPDGLSGEELEALLEAVAQAMDKAAAALPAAGGTMEGDLSMESGTKLTTAGTGTGLYFFNGDLCMSAGGVELDLMASDSLYGSLINLMADAVDCNGSRLVNLPEPQEDSDAATKGYVDGLLRDLAEQADILADFAEEVSL